MHFISTFKKCIQGSKLVNPRIFVGAAAGVLAVILVAFTLTGTTVVSDVGGGFFSPETQEVLPLEIELFDFSILEITEKQATLEIKFKVSNPNYKSIMLQHLKYSVYHNNDRIAVGELGATPEGFLASPNYYVITSERPVPLGEKFTIINTGNNPELWEALSKNELNWRISGEAFFNLSSITAGYENIIKFDFSKHD
tara:strand:- start:118 stop:708 length:591 start_codon:yes stop_codon:yes gene_type:complete